MSIHLLTALAAGLLAAADAPKDDPAQKELDRLQGTYVMAALEVDGKPVAEDKIQNATLVIKGDKYIVTTGGKSYEMAIKLDPAKKPKAIDMTALDGPNKDKVHKGIYELDGDQLKLCRAREPDQDRPAQFGTWPDTGVFLVVWKRQKD